MKCAREQCDNTIPESRRSDAKYCSDKCYRGEKRMRDSQDYARRLESYTKIKLNNSTLSVLSRLGCEHPKQGLDNLGFNFSSCLDIAIIDNEMVYFMFDYGYSIRTVKGNDIVRIWEIEK